MIIVTRCPQSKNIPYSSNSGKQMFREAIKTLPISPVSAEFYTYAGKADVPRCEREGTGYVQMCKREGIIPGSWVKLLYDSDKKMFLPTEKPDDQFANTPVVVAGVAGISRLESLTRMNLFLSGGKTDGIELEIEVGDKEAYSHLKNEFLDTLFGKGYEIGQGSITIGDKVRGAVPGDVDEVESIPETIVGNGILVFDRRKGLKLEFREEFSINDVKANEVLSKWFNELRNKYNSK